MGVLADASDRCSVSSCVISALSLRVCDLDKALRKYDLDEASSSSTICVILQSAEGARLLASRCQGAASGEHRCHCRLSTRVHVQISKTGGAPTSRTNNQQLLDRPNLLALRPWS